MMTLPMVWGGVRLGQDTATQFYPWYVNLGERLRAGGVPEWNSTQFGGAPLAGDPQSGWMYLPAMLLFTLLPIGAAVLAQIFSHLLLANLGMWLLARRVGLGQLGALVAGFSLAGSGVVYGRIPSGPASYQVVTWLPWVLLGAEIALRARSWPVRIGGWALTGFAVSQALAAWVGQVSYYTLLLLGAWLVFRIFWGRSDQDKSEVGPWSSMLAPVSTLGGGASPLPPPFSPAPGSLDHLKAISAHRSWRGGDGNFAPPLERNEDEDQSDQHEAPLRAMRRHDESIGGGVGEGTAPRPPYSKKPVRFKITLSTGALPAFSRVSLCQLLVHGTAMLAIGLGLSAAGLLPRLEFNSVSNASGGEYSTNIGAIIGGSSSESVINRLFQPSLYYPGAAVLALAVVGLLLARGRFGSPFWLVTAIGAIVLTIPAVTPLHWLLYLLPQFRTLHEHWPERVILVAFPGLALLAGAGAQVLVDAARAPTNVVLRAAAVLLPGVIMAGFGLLGGSVSGIAIVAVTLVALVAATLLFRERPPWPSSRSTNHGRRQDLWMRWLPASLLVVVVADVMLMTQALAGQAPFGGFHRRDLDAYYAPSGAAAFLQQQAESEGPFRFAGYDSSLGVVENGQSVLYRYQFPDPITQELVVNNRATILGLEDIQGYNPLQIHGYVDLVTAMNDGPQEYHGANLLPPGLSSPLLGLLNVQYLVIPSGAGGDVDSRIGLASWTTVYDDGTVRVVQNPAALPRLWAVDNVETVAEGQALPLLATGAVDPRTTALMETGIGPDAPVLPAADPNAAGPTLMLQPTDDPDTIRFDATTASDTLVVLSEIAYPGWVAEIGGQATDLLTVNHTFRAVVVPAGQHAVTLRYDSPATRYGLLITGVTSVLTLAGWLAAVWFTRHRLHQ